MNLNAVAYSDACVQRNSRVNAALLSNPGARADDAVRADLSAIADVCVLPNHGKGSDASAFTHRGKRSDDRSRMNSAGNGCPFEDHGRGFRKRYFRLFVP